MLPGTCLMHFGPLISKIAAELQIYQIARPRMSNEIFKNAKFRAIRIVCTLDIFWPKRRESGWTEAIMNRFKCTFRMFCLGLGQRNAQNLAVFGTCRSTCAGAKFTKMCNYDAIFKISGPKCISKDPNKSIKRKEHIRSGIDLVVILQNSQ